MSAPTVRSHLRLLAVVAAGFLAGVAAGHPVAAAVLALALLGAAILGGFGPVLAVCVGTIALGSASPPWLKEIGVDERWVALFTLALWPWVSRRRPRVAIAPAVLAPAAGFMALAAMSAAWSVDPPLTLARGAAFAVLLWVGLVVLPLYTFEPGERDAVVRSLAALCVAGALAALVLGAVDPSTGRVGGVPTPEDQARGLPPTYGALQGWLENSNTVGLWCALLSPFVLALRPRRLAWAVIAPVVGAAVVLSQSRSALLVLLLVVLAMVPRWSARRLAIAAGTFTVLLVLALTSAQTVLKDTAFRKFADRGEAGQILTGARAESWRFALEIFPDRPAAGFGFGGVERAYEVTGAQRHFKHFVGSTPSNAYLVALVELGVLGLALLGATLVSGLQAAWPRRRIPRKRPFVLMFAGALVAGLVESVFTSPGSPFSILLWGGLGAAAAGTRAPVPAPLAVGALGGRTRAGRAGLSVAEGGVRLLGEATARPLAASAAVGLAAIGLALAPPVNRALASVLPSLYGTVIDRLPGRPAAPREPAFTVPIELRSLRRAAAIMPGGARYYVHRPADDGLLGYNLAAATSLYLSRQVPVRQPRDAEWVVSYQRRNFLPAGLGITPRRLRGWYLSRKVVLLKVSGS
jgi:O-antigen ligase